MNDLNLPDLSFKHIQYGSFETVWDLRGFLYQGGAGAKRKLVAQELAQGKYGHPILERLPLVEKIHEYIQEKIVSGGSRGSAATTITRLREFFSWLDHAGKEIDMASAEEVFIEWTDHLLYRKKVVGDIKEIHAYQAAVAVAKVLNCVLELRTGLISKARVRRPSYGKNILGAEADKQNLEKTFVFGHALLDIIYALDVDKIRGPLPVRIQFRSGYVHEEWLRLKPPQNLQYLQANVKPSVTKRNIDKRNRYQADQTMKNRHSLANLRIQAEILVFISQTGMNLEQVHQLKMCKFRYSSHLDGYQVFRVYKGRRQGEVAFEIFSEYREIFERYLAWRADIFPNDESGLIFPLICVARLPTSAPVFSMVQKICKRLKIRYIGPRALRKTRINWLLRHSVDASLTAEMHAHTQETLIRNYEQPNLQVAMAEICNFHAKTGLGKAAAGPGLCIKTERGSPQALSLTPPETASPDCISPAGCLFCVHQRDIDSEDHIWSLASYRFLKSLELALYRPSVGGDAPHPALATIDRITAKLRSFQSSSEVRALWVSEALSRIEEGYHHPRWSGFVALMEMKI